MANKHGQNVNKRRVRNGREIETHVSMAKVIWYLHATTNRTASDDRTGSPAPTGPASANSPESPNHTAKLLSLNQTPSANSIIIINSEDFSSFCALCCALCRALPLALLATFTGQPSIQGNEKSYMMKTLSGMVPTRELGLNLVVSVFTGCVRAVSVARGGFSTFFSFSPQWKGCATMRTVRPTMTRSHTALTTAAQAFKMMR